MCSEKSIPCYPKGDLCPAEQCLSTQAAVHLPEARVEAGSFQPKDVVVYDVEQLLPLLRFMELQELSTWKDRAK